MGRGTSILTVTYIDRCQDKATCEFDPSLIISHVDPSNNSTSLSYNYVFEWAQVSISKDALNCPKNAIKSNDSCYRVSRITLVYSHIHADLC